MAPRNMTMATMLVLGLLAMVQQSVSLFGVITTSSDIEKALNASGFVIQSSEFILGRRFVRGEFAGAPVVYCRTTSKPPIQIALSSHIMAHNYNIEGAILLGHAGAINESLNIGDVAVPAQTAYTGLFTWVLNTSDAANFRFDIYNSEPNVVNLLAGFRYEQSEIIHDDEVIIGYQINATSSWLDLASQVEINTGNLVAGLRSVTSDIYVRNLNYGKALYTNFFGASTVDMDTGGAGMAAATNNVNFIAFLGISNKVGSKSTSPSDSELASSNVVKALEGFFIQTYKSIRYVTE